MSARRCTINVTDRNETQKTFILSQTAPLENLLCTVSQCCPNTRGAKDGSTSVYFSTITEYYVVTGVSRFDPHGKTHVQSSCYRAVSLGPGGSVVAITERDGSPIWDDEAVVGKIAHAPGTFEIYVDNTLKASDSGVIYIGVGLGDPATGVKLCPVQTWNAEPGRKVVVSPKHVYYLTTGQYATGDIIDSESLGSVVKIDFSSATTDEAYISYNADGTYSDENGRSAENGVYITSEFA